MLIRTCSNENSCNRFGSKFGRTRTPGVRILFQIGILVLLLSPAVALDTPLDSWTERYQVPTGDRLVGMTYGDGRFVAVTRGGLIITSADGLTWTQKKSDATADLSAITHAVGQFVAVGGRNATGGIVVTSTDGKDWAQRQSGIGLNLLAVTHGNGRFVAVGPGGTIATSFDGIVWEARRSSVLHTLKGVTYGNGMFVAVGSKAAILWRPHPAIILTSVDGATWVQRETGVTNGLWGVAFGDGRFVAVGGYSRTDAGPMVNGTILTSEDGVNWTSRLPDGFGGLSGVAYGNGQFVAVGQGNQLLLTSSEGANWAPHQFNSDTGEGRVGFGNGYFLLLAAESIFQSSSVATLMLSSDSQLGLLRLSISGPKELWYDVESSGDLKSWSFTTTIQGQSEVMLDPQQISSNPVFFRAKTPNAARATLRHPPGDQPRLQQLESRD